MKTGTKIAVWIIIIIATAAFLCLGLAVTMMLAPGLEIFGVKYVSAKVGKYKFSNNVKYSASNIILNTGDVPIEITYGMSGSLGLEFVQNFQGFTKSADTAGVKITNGSGNSYIPGEDTVVFDITEYKKFIWANSMQDFYLVLRLPLTALSTGSIKINSSRSDVTFKGASTNLSAVDIQTKGKINLQNEMFVSGDFKVSTNSALTLGDNITITGNVVANMGNEDLTITNPVGKDITFNSGAGNLKFNTCQNLKATTGSGSIKEPKPSNMISGSLEFNSNSGSVEIGSVLGSTNSVKTRSGYIKLGYGGEDNGGNINGNLTISTLRSTPFVLGNVHNATINIDGNASPVIKSVSGNLSVSAQGSVASVTCGAIDGDANISVKDGAITLNGAVGGKLTATTSNGNITAGVINGKTQITSLKGRITLATIKGSDNIINNQRGSVNVQTIVHDLKTTSCNNAVYTIGSVDQLEFTAQSGAISVGSVSTSAKISTNANVSLGASGDVADVEVSAGYGNVTLSNTIGNVLVTSKHKTTLQNKSSQDIKINKYYSGGWKDYASGGEVVATGLKGAVAVYSTDKITLTFAEVTANVDVVSSSGSEKVKIDATCIRYNQVNYNLNTQTSSSSCRVWYGATEHTTAGQSSAENTNAGISIGIKVKTSGAPIELRLAD